MISPNQLKPKRDEPAWNYSSNKADLFVWAFHDNFFDGGKVTCAHRIVNAVPCDNRVIFHRRRKRFVRSTDTPHICLLRKGGFRFAKRKQWLTGLKFDQPVQDPLFVSITPKVVVVLSQCSEKLRVSRIQGRRSFQTSRRLFPLSLHSVE